MSAEDRREQVIRAAVSEFSMRGLEGTSTADIAKRVGVSQPYLFRLFPTKKALFIEACNLAAKRVCDAFTAAAEGKYGFEALSAMGAAYQALLSADRELLGMELQQFAACHDPEIQQAVRDCMHGVWQHAENLTGAPVVDRVEFFARGMLCNMIAAMGRNDGHDPVWEPAADASWPGSGRGEESCGTAGAAGLDEESERLRYAEYVAANFAGRPALEPAE